MCAGRRLGGDPDPGEVAQLNLPSIAGVVRREQEATQAGAAGKSEQPGASGSTSQEAIPFVLSEALPVVPGKLVKKILRGEFVDMAELLKDNVEAERRRLAPGENSQIPRPSRREIPDFESWLQCFSSYAAVVGSKYPHKCKELWAYQAFMIAEHRKCGGRGWLLYDNAFRQQIPSLERLILPGSTRAFIPPPFWPTEGRASFAPDA